MLLSGLLLQSNSSLCVIQLSYAQLQVSQNFFAISLVMERGLQFKADKCCKGGSPSWFLLSPSLAMSDGPMESNQCRNRLGSAWISEENEMPRS